MWLQNNTFFIKAVLSNTYKFGYTIREKNHVHLTHKVYLKKLLLDSNCTCA